MRPLRCGHQGWWNEVSKDVGIRDEVSKDVGIRDGGMRCLKMWVSGMVG